MKSKQRQVHDDKGCTTRLVIGTTCQIEGGMQELVKLVVTKTSQDLPSDLSSKAFSTLLEASTTLPIVMQRLSTLT